MPVRAHPDPQDTPRPRIPTSFPSATSGTMDCVPVPGKRLKKQVEGDLDHYASKRWPDLEEVTITWRGSYGYIRAWTTETEFIPLARIQYLGSDHYGFALHQASTETYVATRLPTGALAATPREALDCALGLYLNDPTAWETDPQQD